ncbi:chemotaxis protein CheX [Desulfosarcina sp.]|uniref:chemotaxis protein CheX n=1 Tax=Desulfosarcina sp. TaxID=2027861 RepID=UPI003970C7B7
MDKNLLLEAMKASISEVLETMFFMPVDFGPTDEKSAESIATINPVAARLEFSGSEKGCFHLQVPEALARNISADFMGIDPTRLTRDDVTGTVNEMINMLAGNTLSHYDPTVAFDLSVPEKVPAEKQPPERTGASAMVRLHIQTLDNRMLLAVTFRE